MPHLLVRTGALGLAVLLMTVTASALAPVSALAAPAITATPGSAAGIWVISGTGFEPGTRLNVGQVPCGELPCPRGGGVMVWPTVEPDGTFTATLDLTDAHPAEGQDDFLVVAWDSGEALPSHPTLRVPRLAPTAPAVGTGVRDKRDLSAWIVVAPVLLLAGVAGFAATTRDRQT